MSKKRQQEGWASSCCQGAYCRARCEEDQRMWWMTGSRWLAGEPSQSRSGQKPGCTTWWNSGVLRKWVQGCGLAFPEALEWKAGRQESAGYSPPDDMERQRPEGTGWMQGDKSELGFNKKRFVLIAQRMLIVAMCEIDFWGPAPERVRLWGHAVVNHDLTPSLSLLITKQALKKTPGVSLSNLDIVCGQHPF